VIAMPPDEREIERADTAIRAALCVLYALAIRFVLDGVMLFLVGFGLLYTLITRRRPGRAVRDFSNKIAAYYYRILRYVTYNDSAAPFPFSDVPEVLEPSRWSDSDSESELFGLRR
jgi:hypothetical protein